MQERFRGCLLGLAAGDAVGTSVEFEPRGTFAPVVGMHGGGPFGLEPGEWTDDTSMALCLGWSLTERGFDPRDQMDRYVSWWRHGYMSSNGRCFDIGGTVRAALSRYRKSGDPYAGSGHARGAGNGCIMRLAPVALFFYPDRESTWRYAAESSRTTHGAAECLDACCLLGDVLHRALSGWHKDDVLLSPPPGDLPSPRIAAIARGAYRDKSRDEIRGSGYVVECLEAALWCFHRTGSFREAVLEAANLGDDADTTAAVCGQVAGAFYGEQGIPSEWLECLAKGVVVRGLADRLYRSSCGGSGRERG